LNGAEQSVRSALACLLLCVCGHAQSTSPARPPMNPGKPPLAVKPADNAGDGVRNLFGRYFMAYTQPILPAMTFTDSRGDTERAQLLLKDGEIRLSIKDAIALAIENNLDIESVRLLRPMALADDARAHSGQLLRNRPSAINPGAVSASGNLATASPFGFASAGSPGGVLSGLVVQLAGSPIPNTEPVLFASGKFSHDEMPQSNETVTGTNFLNTNEQDWGLGLRKGFFTGTQMTLQFDSIRTSRNAPFDTINPSIQGDASVRVDQHLLQGFGWETNRRAIYISRNNGKIADLTFRQQVMLTVSQVLGLYYDLVSFQEQAKVLEESLKRSKHDVEMMQQRLDMGLISESDLIAEQIDVATQEQALGEAQAQIEEQEATLKSVLTHAGLEDPRILKAHIVPTDEFKPGSMYLEKATPEELADLAISRRSEVRQGELGLANKKMSLMGTRNALKPTFDVYATLESNALAGQPNKLAPVDILAEANPGFVGGFGTVLDQLARRTYPDYEVGFQLNVPLVNRAAQSDLARDQIDLRQQQIAQQAMRNGIRLQALKAALGLKQAHTLYDLSVRSRILAEKNLDTESKMFDFGTSDPEHMRAAQGGLDRARIQEITARNTYARAEVNLQAVLDETIEAYDIVLEPTKPVR
jgi:outer membrane protein